MREKIFYEVCSIASTLLDDKVILNKNIRLDKNRYESCSRNIRNFDYGLILVLLKFPSSQQKNRIVLLMALANATKAKKVNFPEMLYQEGWLI